MTSKIFLPMSLPASPAPSTLLPTPNTDLYLCCNPGMTISTASPPFPASLTHLPKAMLASTCSTLAGCQSCSPFPLSAPHTYLEQCWHPLALPWLAASPAPLPPRHSHLFPHFQVHHGPERPLTSWNNFDLINERIVILNKIKTL
jgi:hypothetical protein